MKKQSQKNKGPNYERRRRKEFKKKKKESEGVAQRSGNPVRNNNICTLSHHEKQRRNVRPSAHMVSKKVKERDIFVVITSPRPVIFQIILETHAHVTSRHGAQLAERSIDSIIRCFVHVQNVPPSYPAVFCTEPNSPKILDILPL